jgi:hypothetical protein
MDDPIVPGASGGESERYHCRSIHSAPRALTTLTTLRPWVILAVAISVAACQTNAEQSGSSPSSVSGSTPSSVVDTRAVTTDAVATSTVPDGGWDADAEPQTGSIVVDLAGDPVPFDRRLIGTNAHAGIAPAVMRDPAFQQRINQTGTTVIRAPGGSWSSVYDWLDCETGDACTAINAARPSDFAALIAATGTDAIWTVNVNGTAQEAAALVAYFNGTVDDDRTIGVDRRGRDWGTVGQWAQLRTDGGQPDPVRIDTWEVGNELFGGKPEAGPPCSAYGWEEVWTCDGAVYVEGDEEHDGYLDFRSAMKAVDPTVLVGAVGIGGDQTDWSRFGVDVIDASAGAIDFYIIHDYGWGESPSIEEALGRPIDAWVGVVDQASRALADRNPGRNIPIAVTEFNLVAGVYGDQDGTMAEAVNAFYTADTLGQMALHGVTMANHWVLVNGVTESGSDYGIIDLVAGNVNPPYYALALWSRMGDELLPIDVGFDQRAELSAYAGRTADGTVTLLVLNKTSEPIEASVEFAGASTSFDGGIDVASAASMDAQDMLFNGSGDTAAALAAESPARSIGPIGSGTTPMTFDPVSMTLVTLTPSLLGS